MSEEAPAAKAAVSARDGLYIVPLGIVSSTSAELAVGVGRGKRLAGGVLAFVDCEMILRRQGVISAAVTPVEGVRPWAERHGAAFLTQVEARIARLTRPRPPFAGLSLDRPRVMGVVNVTPDSFSDGGEHADPASAVSHGVALLEAGADILDVGGESTRPGAQPVPLDVEIGRVLPVVRELANRGALVSIDTRHSAVMATATQAGARIINDVTALRGDPESLAVAARSGASVILMHMRGEPASMQEGPIYHYAPLDVYDALTERISACVAAGIGLDRLCIDPGIGFGKTVAHNIDLLGRLTLFHGFGCPVMLGVSRKRFIAHLSREEPPKERLAGSLAAALAALDQGIAILRVHDVAETLQAVSVWRAIKTGGVS